MTVERRVSVLHGVGGTEEEERKKEGKKKAEARNRTNGSQMLVVVMIEVGQVHTVVMVTVVGDGEKVCGMAWVGR